ncbi:MAG: hypothetical protein ACFBWO_10365 [Paracoccaceae bacterium]
MSFVLRFATTTSLAICIAGGTPPTAEAQPKFVNVEQSGRSASAGPASGEAGADAASPLVSVLTDLFSGGDIDAAALQDAFGSFLDGAFGADGEDVRIDGLGDLLGDDAPSNRFTDLARRTPQSGDATRMLRELKLDNR